MSELEKAIVAQSTHFSCYDQGLYIMLEVFANRTHPDWNLEQKPISAAQQ